MLDLRLFANRTFTGASIVVAVLGGASFGSFVYLSLFLLEVQGRSPVETGLVLAPLAVVSFVVSLVAGRFNERVPLRGTLVAGLVVMAAGNLLLAGVTSDASFLRLLPGLAVVGAGVGLVNPLATFAHLGVMSPAHGGLASAVNNTARQIGLAIGIAALGALVERSLPAATGSDAYARAFTDALGDVYVIAAVATLLTAAAAWALIRADDLWSAPPPAPQPPPRAPVATGAT
jgi:predicted MFS family arabinose efflux permease